MTSRDVVRGHVAFLAHRSLSAERDVTYPGVANTSWGASSDGVLFRNKPVPNSTKFIGELRAMNRAESRVITSPVSIHG